MSPKREVEKTVVQYTRTLRGIGATSSIPLKAWLLSHPDIAGSAALFANEVKDDPDFPENGDLDTYLTYVQGVSNGRASVTLALLESWISARELWPIKCSREVIDFQGFEVEVDCYKPVLEGEAPFMIEAAPARTIN